MRTFAVRTLTASLAASLVGVFALAGVSGAAAAGSGQGVTSKSVSIGFVYPKTGVATATSGDSDVGCRAAVGATNAKGGVNGRKVNVIYVDDASSGANLTATQDLVQNKHVYAVVEDSPFFFLTWRWVLQNNVPVIGGGYDGTEYGQAGNEKLISGLGNTAPVVGVSYDTQARMIKQLGGTKGAGVGYGISPSSSASAKAFTQFVGPALGIKGVYTNASVDFGSTDVSPIVLGIKNSGADSAYYAMNANTNLAIAQGLAQNGVKMKAQIMATGYGQQLLDQPIAKQIGTDVLMTQGWAPVELKSTATKQFQANLKKYAKFTGVPDFGVYTGYVDCLLAIAGIQAQGKTLDQATFADALRGVGKLNPGGLGCADLNLSAATYGKPAATQCSWAVYVKNGKFAILKPKGSKNTFFTGNLISASVSSS